MNKKIIISFLLLSLGVFSGCGPTKQTSQTPTPTTSAKPRLTKVTLSSNPTISLTSRADGHELKLIASQIPAEVSKIEYELTYVAVDGTTEIEKGLGDTITKVEGGRIERDLLLGTASCTSGCKYKYDTGVKGGHLKLNFITSENGVSVYESDFSLQTGAEYKKSGSTVANGEKLSFAPKSTNSYVVVVKSYTGELQATESSK